MLGKNLKEIVRGAWESEERHKLQQEVENGLSELGKSLTQAINDLRDSSTGQRLRAEVEELHTRIRSGEVEAEARENMLGVLRKINAELAKAIPQKPETPPPQGETSKEG
jgi:hypothetical protein